MKRQLGWLVLMLFLTGCGSSGSNDTADTTSTESTVESSGTTTETKTAMTSDTGSTQKTNEKSTSTEKNTGTSQNTTKMANTMQQLQEAFPAVLLPANVPIQSGTVLNAATDGNSENLSILYYQQKQQLVLDDRSLNDSQPRAGYKKTIYPDAAAAKSAINVTQETSGGQTVDLGHGLTGVMQGAAGSSYLTWQEGNWTLTVRASNVQGQDPIPEAKKVVEYLEQAFLPAPKDTGKIMIDMNASGYQKNTVMWQASNVVYTVYHEDMLSALEMAVSMNGL